MGRHKDGAEEYCIEQMQKVIACITDRQHLANVKSWNDLWNVAYQWCAKNYKNAHEVADEWGVAPMYLLLTALLYVEHPLLVADGQRWKYGLVRAQAEIMRVELNRLDMPVPINATNSVHMGVERNASPVERMD